MSAVSRTTPLDELPQFLSTAEVQTVLNLGRSSVYELCRTGALEHVRLGRILRVPRAAIMKLVDGKSA